MKYSTEREMINIKKGIWFSSMLASLFITLLNSFNSHKFIFSGDDDSIFIWNTNTFVGFIVMFIIFTFVILMSRAIVHTLVYEFFKKALHPKDEIADLEKKIEKINIRIRNLKGDWSVEDDDD